MGGKKVTGRKRHILVDTCGNLLHVVVHGANISEQAGCLDVIDGASEKYPALKHIWVDGGYTGITADVQRLYGIDLEVVKKLPNQHTFVVLPRRWVVERTFAWLGRYRTLSKEYTWDTCYSEAHIYIASWNRMIRRLKPHKNAVIPYQHRKHDRKGVLIET